MFVLAFVLVLAFVFALVFAVNTGITKLDFNSIPRVAATGLSAEVEEEVVEGEVVTTVAEDDSAQKPAAV